MVNESGLFEKHATTLRVRPNGTLVLTESINATGEADLDLARYPFDTQRLDATFEVLGLDASEVVFHDDHVPSARAIDVVRIPQWSLRSIETTIEEREAYHAGTAGTSSTLLVSLNVERRSFFVVRLVVIPLALIVMLSWSVFWMDRASLGDRVNVSFIGILTAVSFQIVISEILPDISYVTLMTGFLNLSFFIMCATMVISLVVGRLDQSGRAHLGDGIDRACRWLFPATYFGLWLVMYGIAIVWF